jgi:hypothetical protein
VTPRFLAAIVILFACTLTLSVLSAAQDSPTSSTSKPQDVSGAWQVSWQGRLGTEQGTLQLQQDGKKITGTFQDVHGVSSLSGTIEGKQISYEVQFQGARPFTTRFTGTLDKTGEDAKIVGTSQAIGVGATGAYMGHAGEVVQPEHPWSAKRAPSQPVPSAPASN